MVIYRLQKWLDGDYPNLLDTQVPCLVLFLGLFAGLNRWGSGRTSFCLLLNRGTLMFLAVFGLIHCGELLHLYRHVLARLMSVMVFT